jgi:hypothetical protein
MSNLQMFKSEHRLTFSINRFFYRRSRSLITDISILNKAFVETNQADKGFIALIRYYCQTKN